MAREANVHLQVRLREDLRQHLAQAARARRVSLNQEIVDRLEYTRERRGLLREVLELTYGPSLGGLLMVLAIGLMGAGHREAARQAGWPLHDPEWLNNPVAFDAAAAVACGLLFAFRPRHEAGDAELDKEGQALASGMLASILESVRHAPDLPTEGLYSNPPPSHDAKIAHALLGPLVERLTDARLHQAFSVEIRVDDQPEGAPGAELQSKPTGAGSSGGKQRDDAEPDRERVGSNPVITLTHREFGPMQVRVSDDVSWWARERSWNEVVPPGATSERVRKKPKR
jgi:hypothetical protein